MSIRISFFVVAFWIHATAWAQQPCVLRVVDDGAPVPGATVVLDGRPVGATNVSGEWVWEDGQGDLQIRALGYETLEWEEGRFTSSRLPTGLRILRPARWLPTWMRFTRDGLGRRANECEAA